MQRNKHDGSGVGGSGGGGGNGGEVIAKTMGHIKPIEHDPPSDDDDDDDVGDADGVLLLLL